MTSIVLVWLCILGAALGLHLTLLAIDDENEEEGSGRRPPK